MADGMTFVNGSSAAFGVVDARTGAFMSLHGTCIEACVAGPSANIEVKHELYNDGVNDVCQGVLLMPIPLEWQVAHITVEYEGEVIDTVHAMPNEEAKVVERVGVNPDLFFHQNSTTPVCSFHLPWTISIGSSLLVTTEYMTSITQSHYLSHVQGHGSEVNEMCQLLLPSSILCLSHSVPNNKNSVKEYYNALFYNTCSSNPFAFRLKHACSLHVIAQTFSPLCQGSVQLTKVGVLDKYNNVYACVNDAHHDNGNDANVNNKINNKTKQSMERVECEVKEIGDCMFDLLYVTPLEELTCMTNANRHLLLTCLLRPSLEPIRVFLDYGKKCVKHSLANAMLAQHNTTTKTSNTITNNSNATTITTTANHDNSSLFDQLKNAVLIQVTPHLDSCPVNVEHIFVIDLSSSKQSKIHAQCIAESLKLALHALPPSVYVNVMCTNSGMLKSKVNATPTLVFGDGSVPIDTVNISMLTNVIAKMCDGAQDDFTTHVNVNSNNNHEKEKDEDVILESLLSLSSMRNAQVKCNPNYVRCVTLITNRTFYSLEMNHTRFAQVIDRIAHQREQTIIINTLAITPNCNGETLAGLELMAHVGKGAFREVYIHEFYDTHTQSNYCNINDTCNNSIEYSEELSCDELTIALNDILASCTIPHLTNIRCDITSDNIDYHFTNNNIITATNNNNSKCINSKADKTQKGNAIQGNNNETNALFVCPDICTLNFAHCQPTYICFFLPEQTSHNVTSNNEMSVTISGNVGKERVEYTYSCPLHNKNNKKNICQEHQQEEIACLDARIVHQCERLIYRQVAKTHVKELSEYVQTGMHINQHEYIYSILAFLSHEYNITNSQTIMELSRKKKKESKREGYANDVYGSTHDNICDDYDKDDVSDEAIRFDDTFSKRLACKDQSVFMPFLHQNEYLHYLLNQWAVKHRARLAYASSQHVSCVPTGALTGAIALQCSTSTDKFVMHILWDIVDSVLSYAPANTCVANAHESEKNENNTKRLLLLQRRNGSFIPSARFALCVGLPLHMAASSSSSSAAIMQFCSIHLHSQNIEEYWATALALAYMRMHSGKLTILSELLCVYYFTHSARVQSNVWESWVESARQVLCCNEE